MKRRRVHVMDPEAFVRSGRERAWCGSYGSQYSPLVEHPDDANCQRCLVKAEKDARSLIHATPEPKEGT